MLALRWSWPVYASRATERLQPGVILDARGLASRMTTLGFVSTLLDANLPNKLLSLTMPDTFLSCPFAFHFPIQKIFGLCK